MDNRATGPTAQRAGSCIGHALRYGSGTTVDTIRRIHYMGWDMDRLAAYFEFLDRLRENGGLNMFGAAPVLAEQFGLDCKEASKVHIQWMKTFDRYKTAQDRAAEVKI